MARARRRGRPSPKDGIIYFDVPKLQKDLEKKLKEVTTELRNELYEATLRNARSLDMRTKKTVRMADGRRLSDRDRREALIKSITFLQTKWTESIIAYNSYKTILDAGVGAIAMDDGLFKESYVGLYYEYGTGSKQDPSGYWLEAEADENPFRAPGQKSVTRSMFRPKDKAGVWKDLGGNQRLTKSPRGGRDVSDYIGEDISAQFWFKNAWKEVVINGNVASKYMGVLKSLNIADYINVKPKFVLGKD